MSEYKRGDERIMRVTEIDGERVSWVCEGELIRCRDCIYWCDEDFCLNPQWQTGPRSSEGIVKFPCTFPDDFCSYSERREVTDER